MNNFFKISERRQINAIETAAKNLKIIPTSVEKDVWVTAVLQALFALPYSDHLSFKGGTSSSKCYNLIERFSEDIDIAVNRGFLGFDGKLSKRKLATNCVVLLVLLSVINYLLHINGGVFYCSPSTIQIMVFQFTMALTF